MEETSRLPITPAVHIVCPDLMRADQYFILLECIYAIRILISRGK